MSTSNMVKHLFNIYTQHFNIINEVFQVVPGKKDIFICPLCFRGFSISDIEILRPEHIPPQSMGGINRNCTLTCKDCNHFTAIAEGRLKEFLDFRDTFEGVPNSSVKGKYSVSSDFQNEIKNSAILPAKLKSEISGFIIEGTPTNPKNIEQLLKMQLKGKIEIKFDFQGSSANKGGFLISLLKIAYLSVFRNLGYMGLFYGHMNIIREQIMNPSQKIIPFNWAMVGEGFSENCLGVNLITLPTKYKSILVVFDLSSGRKNRRFAIFLPFPSENGLEIYDTLKRERNSVASIELLPLSDLRTSLGTQEDAFYFWEFWEFTGNTKEVQ